jgi:hypothetical protein
MRATPSLILALLATLAAAADRYQRCGTRGQAPCPSGYECISDPRHDGRGLACDEPGICVSAAAGDVFCGGIAATKCDDAERACFDDPTDVCDPDDGGPDCGGLCLLPLE